MFLAGTCFTEHIINGIGNWMRLQAIATSLAVSDSNFIDYMTLLT